MSIVSDPGPAKNLKCDQRDHYQQGRRDNEEEVLSQIYSTLVSTIQKRHTQSNDPINQQR